MCIGDWRLGRLITTQATPFDVAAGTGLSYGANSNRIGYMISVRVATPSVNTSVLGTFSDGTIMTLGQGEPNQLVTLEKHGRLPTYALVLSLHTALAVGTVTEFFMPAEYLAAALESFRSQYSIVV